MSAIEDEIQNLGPLKNAAAAIVDYVTTGASRSKSEFHRYGYEWTLEPDNWINLNFIYTRRRYHRIHVSLGVPPAELSSVEGLEIKRGKYPGWSKITIASLLDMPAAFRCIETAYYGATNKYRTVSGKPERPQSP